MERGANGFECLHAQTWQSEQAIRVLAAKTLREPCLVRRSRMRQERPAHVTPSTVVLAWFRGATGKRRSGEGQREGDRGARLLELVGQ